MAHDLKNTAFHSLLDLFDWHDHPGLTFDVLAYLKYLKLRCDMEPFDVYLMSSPGRPKNFPPHQNLTFNRGFNR